ncbi:MAG TPA: G1 family glutamic endopeptidase [Acetobacteraceae bacterium]|nr:G1 family glutamic endopeptidase [Acetobacteraceae bacterium]
MSGSSQDSTQQPPEHGLHQTLLRRSFIYPVPGPDFDPLHAPPEELEKFGIIPRPDPERQPELYAHWAQIFAPPIRFVEPKVREVTAAFQLNLNVTSPATLATETSRYAKSSNWSGAFVVPVDDTMFVLVAGIWIVPTLAVPPPAFRPAGATQYVCSSWVGLDGQRRYLNSSLPQIGTMQTLDVSGSPPQTTARGFFQWWDRENGGSFLQFDGLSVQPGDVMLGAVWAMNPTQVVGYLVNISTAELAWVRVDAPTVHADGAPLQLTVSGATAEWILERPTQFGSTELYAFPDYGTTSFSACWAGAALAAGPPTSFHDLEPARFIRMFDTLHDPTRTVFISMGERQSNSSVRCEYGDFKE